MNLSWLGSKSFLQLSKNSSLPNAILTNKIIEVGIQSQEVETRNMSEGSREHGNVAPMYRLAGIRTGWREERSFQTQRKEENWCNLEKESEEYLFWKGNNKFTKLKYIKCRSFQPSRKFAIWFYLKKIKINNIILFNSHIIIEFSVIIKTYSIFFNYNVHFLLLFIFSNGL